MIYSLQAGSEKGCNISRVEYHAHMHLTCDSEMLHLLPLSLSPLIPPLSLVWRCSNNIKSKMRVGDLGTRCSGDQKHNIIKHSNFLLLFRHAVTSFSSAI